MLNYFFKWRSFECHDYRKATPVGSHFIRNAHFYFSNFIMRAKEIMPAYCRNSYSNELYTHYYSLKYIIPYQIYLKPRFNITAHLISFVRTAPSVNKYSYTLIYSESRYCMADGSTPHCPAHTHMFSLNSWIWTILTVLKGVHIQPQDAQRIAGSCQDLNIIIWPHNPTVTLENTGFLALFFSTGMFVSISLLSDSWLWKMSWEGVPFLILSLESSQTRFVPVSTSFIIPIR